MAGVPRNGASMQLSDPFTKMCSQMKCIQCQKMSFKQKWCQGILEKGRPVLGGKGLQPGDDNTYLGYGKPWANASNTPFRMYKHWVHEGGISSPLIVHWPDGIQQKNEFRDQPAHIIDIMATCIELAGAHYPEIVNDNKIIPFEGVSLSPAFENSELPDRALFWEHEGNKAVRLGKYKLVSKWRKDSEYNWELYDLEADRSETINLIEKMPEKASEMIILWEDWAEKAGVLPWNTIWN